MSTFDENSRYAKYATTFLVKDHAGRSVQAVTPAEIPAQKFLGEHLRKQGQRLDHLAAYYLDDPMGYWRIAHLEDVMSADVLTNSPQIKIPKKR